MRILLSSQTTHLIEPILQDLQTQQLTAWIEPQVLRSEDVCKGEPMTAMTVIALAVSTGGALTVAMGKEGFLTRLAQVLEKYVASQQVEVVIEDKKGNRKQLSGSGKHIERILSKHL